MAQAVLQGHQLFPLTTPRQLDLNYSCSGQKIIKLQISSDVLFLNKKLHKNFQTYMYRHIISIYFLLEFTYNPPPLCCSTLLRPNLIRQILSLATCGYGNLRLHRNGKSAISGPHLGGALTLTKALVHLPQRFLAGRLWLKRESVTSRGGHAKWKRF